MTQRPDDPGRDPALAAAWAQRSSESPPAALDQAILAAAHRAVHAGPRDADSSALARRPQRWWMPLAAAAVIGVVAIGVIQVMPEPELFAPHEKVVATQQRRADEGAGGERIAMAKEQVAAPAVQPAPAMAPQDRGVASDATSGRPAHREAAPATKPSAPAAAARIAEAPETASASAPAAAGSTAQAPTTASARAAQADAKLDARSQQAMEAAPLRAQPAPPLPPAQPSAAPPPTQPAAAPPAAPPVEDRAEKLAAAPDPFPAASPASPGGTAERKSEAPAAPPPPAANGARSRSAPNAMREERQAMGSGGSQAPAAAGRLAPAPSSMPREAAAEPEAARRAQMPMAQTAPDRLAKSADGSARAKARDPDAWLVRIRKLRDEGDVETAARELREFREIVPDAQARIPADMRAWAATVR
jgi:hypothetical protein